MSPAVVRGPSTPRFQLPNDCGDFWIWRDVQLLSQECLVYARVLNRSRRIARRSERADEAKRRPGAVGIARGDPPPPDDSTTEVSGAFALPGQRLDRFDITTGETLAFGVEPSLELGRVDNVEPFE